MKITMKRIYEDFSESDGYRVLVDRLWPRGVSKEKAHLDFWGKEISPSNELREKYHEGIDTYATFKKAYEKELNENPADKDFMQHLKGKPTVTLLSAVRDIEQSHVPIIKEYLENHQSELV